MLDDGMMVHYRDVGNPAGIPLLLIHGGMDSLYTWSLWEPERYRVVSVDLPGHGLTDPAPDRDYGRWLFARFIDDFTQAIELEDFVIVGNS